MPGTSGRPQVTIIGGGMITRIQLLPAVYHLQRLGEVGEIHICALAASPLVRLRTDETLGSAFPGLNFTPHPDIDKVDPDEKFPDLYKDVLAAAPAGSIAVVAVPDHLHREVLTAALENDLHVCSVKPLALKYADAESIARLGYERGLIVGVEYHKRFDYRNLMARREYRAGRLGVFRLGQAHMLEPYYYRDSNFQNWCTCENSDMFTYVGCHYIDLVAFITGLKPVAVSVYGIVDKYPNGAEGYLWTDGRVIWENGASLSVADAIGYPDAAAGPNAQGLVMWCQGADDAMLLAHSDQYRGVKRSYDGAGESPGDTVYAEPNPDYFQLIHAGGEGLAPAGYGYRSVEYIIRACRRVGEISDVHERRKVIRRYDREGIMATPANSSYNELVIEAGRKSILAGGREVAIEYSPAPAVRFKEYE